MNYRYRLIVPLASLLAFVLPLNAANAITSGPAQLLNISGRLQVQTADNVMIAGFIITGNPPNGLFDASNLYSELKKGNRTALTYMEDLPYDGYSRCQSALYVQKHNPFIYFSAGIANHVPYSASVVCRGPYASTATWPDLTFISPNLFNDMHNGATVAIQVANGDSWLWKNLPPLSVLLRLGTRSC